MISLRNSWETVWCVCYYNRLYSLLILTMLCLSPISHVLRGYFNYVFVLTTLTFACFELFTVFHSYFIRLMSQSVLHFFSAFCNKNVCSHLKILVFTCLSLARMTQGVKDNFLENIAFVLLINTLLQTKMALVDYRDRVSYLS